MSTDRAVQVGRLLDALACLVCTRMSEWRTDADRDDNGKLTQSRVCMDCGNTETRSYRKPA